MLSERSKQVRRAALELSLANGGYHFGGSFSCVEILIALFDEVLGPEDTFILSKGHGCWAYYVLLQEQGFRPLLEGHPHRDPHNGVPWTTGSLGHGLPAGFGMALARKMQKRPGRVFVLMGDGELQEGTTWETLLLAAHHEAGNLIVIVDANGCQGSGAIGEISRSGLVGPVLAAASAVGWEIGSVSGHSITQITTALSYQLDKRKPLFLAAITTKGKGVSIMEGRPEWHAKFPNPEELATMREELR